MGPGPGYDLVPVYFATDRQPSPDRIAMFGNREGTGRLSYGRITVSVPVWNDIVGQRRTPGQFPISYDRLPDAHPQTVFTVRRIDLLDHDGLFTAVGRDMSMRGAVSGSWKRAVMLFVHGYNVSFREAAFRSAQIVHDTGFAGTPMMYSWPSASRLLDYGADEHQIERSTPRIRQFVADLFDRAHPDRVFIVAHSMGSRGATRALSDLAATRPDLAGRVSALILAAPDIDQTEFVTKIAPGLARIAPSITTYSSRNDRAMVASQLVRCRLRRYEQLEALWRRTQAAACAASLGDAHGRVVVWPPMMSIDVSAAAGTDWLGHSVYAQNRCLLDDMAAIFSARTMSERHWLVPRGDYYVFQPCPPFQ